MRISNSLLFQVISLCVLEPLVNALSAAPSEAANRNFSILQQSLSSIANKLTLSPEIIIPEPTDPTALLLQATEVTKLSNAIRTRAKGNAVFLAGSVNALKIFCQEQETARGNFPGPLPVIYCESSIEENISMEALSDAGAAGILHTLLDGEEIASADDVNKDEGLKSAFATAQDNGIQLIPEVVLKADMEWSEDIVTSVVECVAENCGSDPAAVILTFGAIAAEEEDDDDEEDSSDDADADADDDAEVEVTEIFDLPEVSKTLSKRIPILGSIRSKAGGGRMGTSVGIHKESGFKGCVLRCDCLPGYRMNPDLEFVGGFWGAAIGDLKSTKSKNFNFRSTIALDRDIPLEWYNYQKDIMESGALGSPSGGGGGGDPLDSDKGDYKGF